jgi:hypothetical protein
MVMDPNSNMKEQIRLAKLISESVENLQIDNLQEFIDNSERLSELVLALSDWVMIKGFFPSRESYEQ